MNKIIVMVKLKSCLIIVFLGLSLFACNDSADKEGPRPNIIFVMTDDHAKHAVSAYGSQINETPHIDRLAKEGIKFERAFVSNSLCAPSRAVLLTSKHSHLNGKRTNEDVFDSTQTTYPKMLQNAGYQTAMIGKWHLQSDPTGYDYWDILPGQGDYYNPDFRTSEGHYQVEGYVTDIITDKVIDWLEEERSPEKPFMLNYHHKAPHRNWMPGPDQLALYQDQQIPEPATLYANWSGELSEDGEVPDDVSPGEWKGRTTAVQTQEMTLMDHFSPAWDFKFPPDSVKEAEYNQLWQNTYERFTAEQQEVWNKVYDAYYEEFKEKKPQGKELLGWTYQRYIKDYLATIASVDDNLGRLLDYLDKSGLAENTIVVYTSDQGFFLGDHGWYDKRWMYEESMQIPLVARWPAGIDAGMVNRDLVQNLDFAPTFLDLAGFKIPDDMQGQSLVPLLHGQTPDDWRKSIYYHYYEYPGPHNVPRHYGVRTDRYKLIYYYQIDEWELFDLEKDPNEMKSVYDDPDYTDIAEELKQELQRLRELYQVPEEDSIQSD
jgi:arylsulfatase A-like enzyme